MLLCEDQVRPFPRVIRELYFHSTDMRLLLNILTETNGLWAPLLILALFDQSFRQLFKGRYRYIEWAISLFDPSEC